MELRTTLIVAAACLFLTSCSENGRSDAYGQFEADKTTISAQASGELLSFEVENGMKLSAGSIVGQIDTTQLHLKKQELKASLNSVRSNIAKLNAQADVYREQLTTARKELKRLEALSSENAATARQMDEVNGQVNTLQKQISAVEVQKQSVYAEIETIRTRISQVDDQLQKAVIRNPVNGTVLSTFAEPHELVSQGKPLYTIAGLDEMTLKVYVSGAQLPGVVLGQQVEVFIDKSAAENESLTGEVTWIASEAEFTPRMIQTKEERVTQVYAVEVSVRNPEGKIKIGMPGEVNF